MGRRGMRSSSRAGHVQSCLKMGGPPSKPKYSSVTDSAPVPRGKGEKHPDEGSETVPETGCLQAVGGSGARNQGPGSHASSGGGGRWFLVPGLTAYLLYNGSASWSRQQA